MTAHEYLEGLRRRRPMEIYYMGEQVADPLDHPVMRTAVNAVAKTYELAHQPECADLMVAVDRVTGNRTNRFTKLFQSKEDLLAKARMQRIIGRLTGTCFQRCVGMDALSAVEVWRTRSEVTGVPYEVIRDKMIRMAALRRIPLAEEVAEIAVYLASDAAAVITGQAINTCAGSEMQ